MVAVMVAVSPLVPPVTENVGVVLAVMLSVVEVPVHLFLFVKVREGWGDDPERYREMGLEFPKDG